MDRELLLEIGCEEIPASWLLPLSRQLGERLAAELVTFRISAGASVETHATPRRLMAGVSRISERQTDLDEQVTGPPVAAAFGPNGEPTPAAIGFAKRGNVEPSALTIVENAKGKYVSYARHERGKATVDVLPDVLGATLRGLSFPKAMRWDAWLDDGKGELTFGRPIRWILYLHGGRVVPFVIRRSNVAASPSVQDVRSGAVTYGHRVLAGSGRAGRALKVRSMADYRAKLGEHFVLLEREERHARIARELDAHARRLGGRVAGGAGHAGLLQEVVDLMEYPTVVAGTFAAEFLHLPEEVLATTMIHHQHNFPVADDAGRLLPAFLAVTNIETDNARAIAVNAERVLTARLRDAQFFWQADRKVTLESRLDRLGTLLFHKRLGSYRLKALRLEQVAGRIARAFFKDEAAAAHAQLAGRLAKADLVTGMVREFTELQGTMGGLYARHEGLPEAVSKAIYFHYLPVGVEPGQPPTREALGAGAVAWAAVSVADKLDSVVSLFAAGERPTGTRDPLAMRRQAQGLLRVLVDLPELTGLDVSVALTPLVEEVEASFAADAVRVPAEDGEGRAHDAGRRRRVARRADRVPGRAPALPVREARLRGRRDQCGGAGRRTARGAGAARPAPPPRSAERHARLGRFHGAGRRLQARQEHRQGARRGEPVDRRAGGDGRRRARRSGAGGGDQGTRPADPQPPRRRATTRPPSAPRPASAPRSTASSPTSSSCTTTRRCATAGSGCWRSCATW